MPASNAAAGLAGDGPRPMCVECEDQEAAVKCIQCDEHFCKPCWQMQHRKGKRTLHRTVNLAGDELPEMMPLPAGEQSGIAAAAAPGSSDASTAGPIAAEDEGEDWNEVGAKKGLDRAAHERTLWVPLRLSEKERAWLAVLNGALDVSEYTDNVDTLRWGKDTRIIEELNEMFQLQAGLLSCNDFRQGSRVVAKFPEFSDSKAFYQTMFEIGRRYKIMNPEKMRSTYGKMMFMLMDAVSKPVKPEIGFNVKIPIKTVGGLLETCGGASIVQEPDFLIATAQAPSRLPPDQAAAYAKRKADAFAALKKKYATASFPEGEVERVLHSVADSKVYEDIATGPVRAMLRMLTELFPRTQPAGDKYRNLTLRYGSNGSKLNHSHEDQFKFVHQTLTLWLKCTSEMYTLWSAADQDMLATSSYSAGYRLQNTGQGLNRVQSCPSVSRLMSHILHQVQSECGGWVGLSVVHLGDRDVPNALTFIDKYTQIPRILAPIVQTIESLERLAENKGIATYLTDNFGSIEQLKLLILRDYFLHGFDGSGDDGGSCIDGRLTSTWNWCSKIEKKPYWRVFLLAGFAGFDGDWRTD